MIGAVVVLYNPTHEELININSYKDVVDYTVVIDNSVESNWDVFSKAVGVSTKVHYYSEGKNLGLAKGFNIGINILKNGGCDWVILFDADSKIESDVLSVYSEAMNIFKRDVAVFAPIHLHDRSNKRGYDGYKRITWAMTSGCLYNCEIFELLGGFFEELFVDGLDMDYCLRANEKGFGVIECGSALIRHKPAETKKIFGIKYGIASPGRYYMQARQLIWNWKRYRKFSMLLIYMYKWVKVLVLFPQKLEYIKCMRNGTREGIRLVRGYTLNGK